MSEVFFPFPTGSVSRLEGVEYDPLPEVLEKVKAEVEFGVPAEDGSTSLDLYVWCFDEFNTIPVETLIRSLDDFSYPGAAVAALERVKLAIEEKIEEFRTAAEREAKREASDE